MTTIPPAKDGATTALHRRIEELTAELERMRVTHGDRDEWVLATQRADAERIQAEAALAAERAARKEAEKNARILLDANQSLVHSTEQAERERDTALTAIELVRVQVQFMREQAEEFKLNPNVSQTFTECANGVESQLAPTVGQASLVVEMRKERDTALARVKELDLTIREGTHQLNQQASHIENLVRLLEEAKASRAEWCRQCNMASEAQADALNAAAAERKARVAWETLAGSRETEIARLWDALNSGTSKEVVAHAETLGKLKAAESALAAAREWADRFERDVPKAELARRLSSAPSQPSQSAEPELNIAVAAIAVDSVSGKHIVSVKEIAAQLSRAGLAIVRKSEPLTDAQVEARIRAGISFDCPCGVTFAANRCPACEQDHDGLRLVPAADVPSAEERKVLEAMAAIKQRWLEDMVRTCMGPAEWVETCVRLFKAELARRAAKER